MVAPVVTNHYMVRVVRTSFSFHDRYCYLWKIVNISSSIKDNESLFEYNYDVVVLVGAWLNPRKPKGLTDRFDHAPTENF